MPIMNDLIKAIKNSVDSGKLSVADIASATDCSRQYIYNLMRGKSEPTISVAEKLAKAVGFSFILVSPKPPRKKIPA